MKFKTVSKKIMSRIIVGAICIINVPMATQRLGGVGNNGGKAAF